MEQLTVDFLITWMQIIELFRALADCGPFLDNRMPVKRARSSAELRPAIYRQAVDLYQFDKR
jgi:hypothetical protein